MSLFQRPFTLYRLKSSTKRMDIAKAIRSIRENKRLTKADVAKALDMDFSQYSRQEKKGNKLTLEQIDKIATALEVSRDHLLNHNPDNERRSIEAVLMEEAQSKEAEEEEIQRLQQRVMELEEINAILKEYLDSIKNRVKVVSEEFQKVVRQRGYQAGIGSRQMYKQIGLKEMGDISISATFYQETLTDEQLEEIIDILRKDATTTQSTYATFRLFLSRGLLDPELAETKAFERYEYKRRLSQDQIE